MAKRGMTDEEVLAEIQRLSQDVDVRLARKQMKLRYQQRNYLYQLRTLQKAGAKLREQGYTMENIGGMYEFADWEEDDNGA